MVEHPRRKRLLARRSLPKGRLRRLRMPRPRAKPLASMLIPARAQKLVLALLTVVKKIPWTEKLQPLQM